METQKYYIVRLDLLLAHTHTLFFFPFFFFSSFLLSFLSRLYNLVVQSKHGLLSTVAYKLGPKHGNKISYALEGSVPFAGACIEWLVKRLEIIQKASDSEKIADKNDNGGVYFVPAFSGLYAPYWRDDARGVIVGLTRYANKGHLVRASLEAVCFQTREVCDAMRLDAKMSGVNLGNLSILKVDGGMTINETLMQMQSDILNCEVQRPKIVETTALGAAYVAGLATGYFESIEEVSKQWKLDKTFVPDARAYSDARRTKEFDRWKRAIQRTLHWMDETDPSDMLVAKKEDKEIQASTHTSSFLSGVVVATAVMGIYMMMRGRL